MAKKCVNELNDLNMAEYIFNELGDTPKPQRKVNKERGNDKATKSPSPQTTQRQVRGAARGCKPGYTRHTYVLPEKMINEVKAVAHFFNCPEVAAAEQIIQKGLDDIERKHGKKAIKLQKTQNLFE